MTEFTPGPWRIWGEDDIAPNVPCLAVGCGEIGTPTCKEICLVDSTLDNMGDEFNLTHEDHANARLIAAAPTMYNFVASRAGSGDNEAIAIMEAIDGNP